MMTDTAGQEAGSLELLATSPDQAIEYTQEAFKRVGKDALKEIPGLRYNMITVMDKVHYFGKYQRHDMPVLEETDLKDMELWLHGHCKETEQYKAEELRPLQKQLYLDKCIPNIAEYGIKATLKFIQSNHLYVTKDSFILDGHHRWLSAMLINPGLIIHGFKVDEFKRRALRDSLAFSDFENHKRNK